MSATPRTDKQAVDIIGFYSCGTVPKMLAEQLEREGNELRRALQALVDCPDYRHINTLEMRNARAALARSGKGEA